MQILVVEDNPDARMLLQIELESLGHHVTAAPDGASALEVARREPPEVIMSDLRLPDMHGRDLLTRVRSIPGLKEVPAIAVTGLEPPEDKDGSIFGFDAYVVKPFDIDDMVKALEKVTLRKRVSER
jgi:CheY-like chemotaxis protein